VEARTSKPTVAIVGRPNVGKSTLFNRLVGRRMALVHDRPGVTRDRKEADAALFGLDFRLIDTAGLDETAEDAIEARMRDQTMVAVGQADLVLFLIDARAGVTPLDTHFAELVRRTGIPVVAVANKCEGGAGMSGLHEAYRLGFGEPVPLSAEHNEGFGDLHEAMVAALGIAEEEEGVEADEVPDEAEEEEAGAPLRPLALAIVGRPNAGKSTLFNRLLAEERVITGPEPGLTRDSIAIDWSWQGRDIRLVDTAGLRRRARIEDAVEKLSAGDTFQAIQYADVVILMIDARTVQDFGAGLEKQDLTIARQVEAEGRGLVIVANKWDVVTDPAKTRRAITDSLDKSLAQLRGVPLVCISALHGEGVDRLMAEVLRIDAAWNSRIGTGKLNQWLEHMQAEHQPPLAGGRRIKIRYMTQAKARPPTFALFVNKPADLPDAYLRYLSNGLRRDFGFEGVPIRLHLRKGRNPYAKGR
jgi:GTP-binding protein